MLILQTESFAASRSCSSGTPMALGILPPWSLIIFTYSCGTEEDYKRARYVIGEEKRVLDVCDALEKGDYETVGKRMYETHWGMSKDYEVSCEELDFLAEVAEECGVTGSRIMGGGFGGCTINLVKDELYDNFIATAKKRFNEKYGHEPKVYEVVISDGSRRLE